MIYFVRCKEVTEKESIPAPKGKVSKAYVAYNKTLEGKFVGKHDHGKKKEHKH